MNKTITVCGIIILFIISTVTPLTVGYSVKLISDGFQTNYTKLDSNYPNIMLTGYWNPTGQMIAPYSNNTYLNPDGWKGGNWEGHGYNIYSFFPTPGSYNGTFEIDYQKTWEDFWNITDQVKPIGIISFGAGAGPWEIEFNARNLDRWGDDYEPPYQPTPCPPDNSVPIGYTRHSTLPVQEIEDAVNELTQIDAWIDWEDNPGAFLCEYMAYLGMWYQSIHKNDDLYPCKAAGFIHVKNSISVPDAMNATNVTIRETIKYLDCVENPPEKPIITGPRIGKVGVEYNYTFVTNDPDGDDISFYINWGDSQIEKWIGPFESGKNVVVSHNWSSVGFYKIKAIAKDTCGALSDWGTFRVFMPRNKMVIISLLQNLFVKIPLIERLLIFIIN